VAAYLVVTDGKIVFEWGNTANNFFAHSMRKSLLSGLYGIYVAEGRIDLSKTLAELGIDDKVPLTDEERQATVNDLLKARSGVYIPAAGEAPSMKDARPERHSHPRDTFWYYNNWDFNALGTIFDQETGEQNIYRAFTARIADPLGMQDWIVERLRYTYEPNSRHPYYGVRISARDLARFGQLFLQQGTWQGTEIVPAEWVEESTRVYSLTGSGGTYSGYGYMWWIAAEDASAGDYPPLPKGSYAASGYGGHTLEVLPEYNTVIVVRFNTDDPDVTLRGGFQVDMLVVKTLAAFSRAGNAHTWAWYLVLAWVVLAGASLLVLAVVLVWRRRREAVTTTSPRLVWPWVFVVMVLGPVGLLAYLVVHRQGAAVSC
jgi:CubicO group peptidase (beta-lactamase class C family)